LTTDYVVITVHKSTNGKGDCVMTDYQPGDILVIRGYDMRVLDTEAVYEYSYEHDGKEFVTFKASDGIRKSVDAWRASNTRDAAIIQCREQLSRALEILSCMAHERCGDLTRKQARRFHNAHESLCKLAEEIGA
jgi:hypothetical protein